MEVARGLEQHAVACRALNGVCEQLNSGRKCSVIEIRNVIIEFVDMILLDFDWFPTVLSLQKISEDCLSQHMLNVSLLSMAIAAQLGMSRRQLLDVAMGGLLHDLGMQQVPRSIRLVPRPLTADERTQIQDHPARTLEALDPIERLPDAARFVAYQAHERMDGLGYPRQKPAALIHPYAKIVAVADVYVAMISPRPYRTPYLPYEAVRSILHDGGKNKFDRTVLRALLDCVSLTPTGSPVELSDHTRARVIRANTGQHTRPVIEIMDEAGKSTGRILDLLHQVDLKIAFALRSDLPGEPMISL
jgi:HD-GYP domain-containing protein (c-di-GMP phosphodiesterase class II)